MPDPEGTLVDGTKSWYGGMDASRFPYDVAPDQYHRACNVFIPRTGGGIVNRFGFRCQTLDFDYDHKAKEIYETGHIEAEGWFYDGRSNVLVLSIDGYVFKHTKIGESRFEVKILNYKDRNPSTEKAWITRIPNGAILNNGISNPLIIRRDAATRVSGESSIGPGREGIYIQNRFFYVTPDRKKIIASDFRNPTSIANAISTNIYGWSVPKDSENITALGEQKSMLNYVEGGNLIFSTENNLYSVSAIGDRQDWGEVEGSGYGRVTETIPGIGATSSYSFENFNTNVYFRSRDYGIVDIRQSQYQFTTEEDFEEQSIEVDYWMGRDVEWMLDNCYTRKYKNRLFTTVSPEVTEDGNVFWNGMISIHPNPRHSNNERFPRRFESLITGVRPWAITVMGSPGRDTEMFVHSRDSDGINRMYKAMDDEGFDVNNRGERVDIESWIETRGYDFKFLEELKVSKSRYYTVSGFYKDIGVKVSSRLDNSGHWRTLSDLTLRSGEGRDSFIVADIRAQRRRKINLPEPEYDECGNFFYSEQFRFDVKGAFRLEKLILKSMPKNDDDTVTTQKEENESNFFVDYQMPLDYSYLISGN